MGKQGPNRSVAWSCSGSAGVALDRMLKAEHLHVEVESSAKISAETSPFSGGLAHLHKLVAVTASFVPPSVHPFKFLGGENIPSVLSWLDDQGLHVLKHMLQCFGRGEAAWV